MRHKCHARQQQAERDLRQLVVHVLGGHAHLRNMYQCNQRADGAVGGHLNGIALAALFVISFNATLLKLFEFGKVRTG